MKAIRPTLRLHEDGAYVAIGVRVPALADPFVHRRPLPLVRLAPSTADLKSSILAFNRRGDGERFRRLIEAHRATHAEWPPMYDTGFLFHGRLCDLSADGYRPATVLRQMSGRHLAEIAARLLMDVSLVTALEVDRQGCALTGICLTRLPVPVDERRVLAEQFAK